MYLCPSSLFSHASSPLAFEELEEDEAAGPSLRPTSAAVLSISRSESLSCPAWVEACADCLLLPTTMLLLLEKSRVEEDEVDAAVDSKALRTAGALTASWG